MQLAFGDCVLDLDRRQFERAGTIVHLPPKVYTLLTVLVDQRPKALSKDELNEALWPGLYISESSLTNVVTQLRDAIGDSGRNPHLIRTLHGFGYAFDGEVHGLGDSFTTCGLTCVLQWGERQIVLQRGEYVLGRSADAAVWIPDERVSRRHACIDVGDAEVRLTDLGSRNGTLHRGVRIAGPVALADGDEIRVESAVMVVSLAPAGSTVTSLDASTAGKAARASDEHPR